MCDRLVNSNSVDLMPPAKSKPHTPLTQLRQNFYINSTAKCIKFPSASETTDCEFEHTTYVISGRAESVWPPGICGEETPPSRVHVYNIFRPSVYIDQIGRKFD